MTRDSNTSLFFFSEATRLKSTPKQSKIESSVEKNSNKEPHYYRLPYGSEKLVQQSAKDDTENTSKERGASSHVIEFERWDCVIKEVNKSGVRVYAIDSNKQYASRFFTFKSQYFEMKSKERLENLFEGQRLEWVLKRIKSSLGQETKVEEINVYKRISKPEWQLKMEVERQMEDLKFLFQD